MMCRAIITCTLTLSSLGLARGVANRYGGGGDCDRGIHRGGGRGSIALAEMR